MYLVMLAFLSILLFLLILAGVSCTEVIKNATILWCVSVSIYEVLFYEY